MISTAPETSSLPPDPLFDGIMSSPPVEAPPSGSSGDPLLDFLGPAPEAPPPPMTAAPRRASNPGMAAAGSTGSGSPVLPASAAAPAPVQAPVACRECGKSLDGPF